MTANALLRFVFSSYCTVDPSRSSGRVRGLKGPTHFSAGFTLQGNLIRIPAPHRLSSKKLSALLTLERINAGHQILLRVLS